MSLTIIVAAAVTAVVLFLGAVTTDIGPWYVALRKPSWNPPNWVFGPAWTLILGLAAWAGVLAWNHARDESDYWRIGVLFAVNLSLHMAWSPLFFNLRRPDWALREVPFLWLSVLALILGLAPIDQRVVWLLLPYLFWVGFAAYLNFVIVRLNRS